MLSLNGLKGVMLAELKDTTFSEDATLELNRGGWLAGMCVNQDNQKKNLFYLSNDNGMASKAGRLGSSEAYRTLKPEIVGCIFFASINLSKMLYAVSPYAMMFGASPKLYETLESLDRLNVKMTDLKHFFIELNLKKDIRDLLL
jgi:hypothetical protein